MSWNGFPRYVGNSILRKLEKRKTVSNEVANDDSTEEKTFLVSSAVRRSTGGTFSQNLCEVTMVFERKS